MKFFIPALVLLASFSTCWADCSPLPSGVSVTSATANFDGSCVYHNPSVSVDGQSLPISAIDSNSVEGLCGLFNQVVVQVTPGSNSGTQMVYLNQNGTLNSVVSMNTDTEVVDSIICR